MHGNQTDLWINPTFKIGNLSIAWYAIFIMVGVIIAVYVGIREGKKIGIASDHILTGVIIVLPCAIIGARLWYVINTIGQINWTFTKIIGMDDKGLSGLAIQGGVIAALIAVYIYCRVRKIKLYKILDLVAPGFLIGQICGRWGNFCNHELYGPIIQNPSVITWFPWLAENMYINGAFRHPTFLYESLLNLVGLVLMLIARRKFNKLQSGDLMGFYLVWYGSVRIFTELLRNQSGAEEVLTINIFGMNILVSLMWSIIFILCGVAFLIVKRFVGPKENYLDILKYYNENKIDTILFDLDGTLIDSKELIFSSFVYTFEKFRPGYKLSDEELNSFFFFFFMQTFSRYSNDEKEIDEMIKYYREYNISNHDEMIKPMSNAKQTLKKLHSRGYALGIVSSKKDDLVIRGLEVCGLIDYIDLVIGCDDVKNHKPAPDGILMAIDKLHAKNVLYVGDHPNDIKAGKNANVKTVACLYATDLDKLLAEEPDYTIKNLDNILQICME